MLDQIEKIKTIDKHDIAKSIELLPKQMNAVLEEFNSISIPKNYAKINNVVLSGMGGSNLGAHIIKSVFADKIKVPFEIIAGYDLPGYVDNKTLFILSSYSGTTEEPLHTYKEASKRGAKIIGITSHGENNTLEKLMHNKNLPGYIFEHRFNYSAQPRYGMGRTVFGLMVMLAKVGLFDIKQAELKKVKERLEKQTKKLNLNTKTNSNEAKKIAKKLHKHLPILIGAEFTKGNLHTLRNQICESSKNYTDFLEVPDMNHFALEGLTYPEINKKNLIFVFFDSDKYNKRTQKRMELTKQVVKKNKIKIYEYKLTGDSKLAQSFEMLNLGSWVSYYLSILNKVDPIDIPWVKWFKQELG